MPYIPLQVDVNNTYTVPSQEAITCENGQSIYFESLTEDDSMFNLHICDGYKVDAGAFVNDLIAQLRTHNANIPADFAFEFDPTDGNQLFGATFELGPDGRYIFNSGERLLIVGDGQNNQYSLRIPTNYGPFDVIFSRVDILSALSVSSYTNDGERVYDPAVGFNNVTIALIAMGLSLGGYYVSKHLPKKKPIATSEDAQKNELIPIDGIETIAKGTNVGADVSTLKQLRYGKATEQQLKAYADLRELEASKLNEAINFNAHQDTDERVAPIVQLNESGYIDQLNKKGARREKADKELAARQRKQEGRRKN
jgi:hypothetical protein